MDNYNNDLTNVMFMFLPMIVILGGLTFMYLAARARIKEREMVHRERLAMIEKGLAPPPEADPMRFQQTMFRDVRSLTGHALRYRSAGVIIIGIGMALMVLLTFTAGEPHVGLGVGGAFVVLGVSFVVLSLMHGQELRSPEPQWRPEKPDHPRDSGGPQSN